MIETIKKNITNQMQKTLEALQAALFKIRTGRAQPSLLETIRVLQQGSEVPLHHLATISLADAKTLLVTPWDKTILPSIAKAILSAELGLNPAIVGNVIRVPLPPLTAERRQTLVKLVKQEAENARISVRNHRREANAQLKALLKKKDLSEDEEKQAQELIQKLTDHYINEIDTVAVAKEKELMMV